MRDMFSLVTVSEAAWILGEEKEPETIFKGGYLSYHNGPNGIMAERRIPYHDVKVLAVQRHLELQREVEAELGIDSCGLARIFSGEESRRDMPESTRTKMARLLQNTTRMGVTVKAGTVASECLE